MAGAYPSPRYPYPPRQGGALLGVHAIRAGRSLEFADKLAQAGASFPAFKIVDDPNWIPQVLERNPNAVTIGRYTAEEKVPDLQDPGVDIGIVADRVMAVILGYIELNPFLLDAVRYWEVVNEPALRKDVPEDHGRLGRLTIECCNIAEREGERRWGRPLKIAGMSYAAGTPEWDAMEALVETGVFRRMQQGGHILALHEGVFSTEDDIKKWWGDLIPGAPPVDGAGALCFRYRYLYHLLRQRDEVVPLVVSEFGNGDVRGAFNPEEMVRRIAWYDGEAAKDWFVWAFCPFTLGPTPWWEPTDWDGYYPALTDWMIGLKDRPAAKPPGAPPPPGPPPPPDPGIPCPGQAPAAYPKDVVLLQPGADSTWARCAVIGTWDRHRTTITASAEDAGVGWPVTSKRVRAVNPDQWSDDLARYFEQYFADADFVPVLAGTPWEMAVLLSDELPPLKPGWDGMAQDDPLWAGDDLGEQPGGETIGEAGCLLTVLCCAVREAYGRDLWPPQLNQLLALEGTPFQDDDLLIEWGRAVGMFPAFDDALKENKSYTAQELADLLNEGWLVGLRVQGGAHFVYLVEVMGDDLDVQDPLGGELKVIDVSEVSGVRAARLAGHEPPEPPPVTPGPLLVGLHDREGGDWMAAQGFTAGVSLDLRAVQMAPADPPIDLRPLKVAGQVTLCRLNWGWAHAEGTMPPPDRLEAHLEALAATILASQGVDYWLPWNEPNNRSEHPPGYELTPTYLLDAYERLRAKVGGRAALAFPPLDPYYGPGSDNSVWWRHLLDNASWAEALVIHAKTQTNDPAEVWSTQKFGDDPLTWQYFHFRVVETYLEMVPERFRGLPVFIGEANPQRISWGPPEVLGWQAGNSAWVHECCRYLEWWNGRGDSQKVTGVAFYRYLEAGDQAPFGLAGKPAILAAIKEEAEASS